MFLLKYLLRPKNDYIWINCILIKETPKAMLIEFDNREIWLPKVWIIKNVGAASWRRTELPCHCERAKRAKQSQAPKETSIKISLRNWAKKSQ